jgi:hypothetical protein
MLTGFGFAFLSFPFKRTVFVILTLGMMVPTEAFIIPLYYEMLYLGLLNSYWAMILPQIAMSMPFATLFMASAMQQIPAGDHRSRHPRRRDASENPVDRDDTAADRRLYRRSLSSCSSGPGTNS